MGRSDYRICEKGGVMEELTADGNMPVVINHERTERRIIAFEIVDEQILPIPFTFMDEKFYRAFDGTVLIVRYPK